MSQGGLITSHKCNSDIGCHIRSFTEFYGLQLRAILQLYLKASKTPLNPVKALTAYVGAIYLVMKPKVLSVLIFIRY